jgi:uncharacterized protein (DUF427 family)
MKIYRKKANEKSFKNYEIEWEDYNDRWFEDIKKDSQTIYYWYDIEDIEEEEGDDKDVLNRIRNLKFGEFIYNVSDDEWIESTIHTDTFYAGEDIFKIYIDPDDIQQYHLNPSNYIPITDYKIDDEIFEIIHEEYQKYIYEGYDEERISDILNEMLEDEDDNYYCESDFSIQINRDYYEEGEIEVIISINSFNNDRINNFFYDNRDDHCNNDTELYDFYDYDFCIKPEGYEIIESEHTDEYNDLRFLLKKI